MSPDYSTYSLEELYEVRAAIDSDRFPERTKDLEYWIEQRQKQPLVVKDIIWLKPTESVNYQKQLLIIVVAILGLLPLFVSFGPHVVHYTQLRSVEGVYKGSDQSYHSATAVFYEIQLGEASYKVAGEWPKLQALKPESRVQMLVFDQDVWEINTNGKSVVSYAEFHQYSTDRKRQNWLIAACLFIAAIFSIVLYHKIKKANTFVLPKPENTAETSDKLFKN